MNIKQNRIMSDENSQNIKQMKGSLME